MKTKIIEHEGIKYEVVRVIEDKGKVIIGELGDITEYERWYNHDYCLEAVKQDGYMLRYVREQDREICLEAVKQNGYALQYVREQDREICLEAVKQNGYALQYVDKRVFPEKE